MQPIFETDFNCSVVDAPVTVSWRVVTLQSGPLQADQAKAMLDCTGNLICRKFLHPVDFTSRVSRGCPFHDRLIRGRDGGA
jgi:hypothetical protein